MNKSYGLRPQITIFDEFPIPQYDPFVQGSRLFFVGLPHRIKRIYDQFMKDIQDPFYSLYHTSDMGCFK